MKQCLTILVFYSVFNFLSLATPDWNKMTNEEFLGSNEEVYAVMQTVSDNQGNYYSSREIKTFYEFSKTDNTIINQELISDIVYNIDPEHIDPNTPPKVTKVVKAQNKKLLLATLTTDYKKPTIAPRIPAWVERLTWKNEGIFLDEKLLIIPKSDITDKELPFDTMKEAPVNKAIVAVYQDNQCIYLSIKFGDDQHYENAIVRISPEISKQINDWSTKLSDYLLISEHDTKEQANKESLKLIKRAKEKDYYAMNLEIWSIQKAPNKLSYLVVHRPFDVPMDATKIKLLNSIIERATKTVKSTEFIEKWIPFSPPEKLPEEDEPEDEPETIPDVPDSQESSHSGFFKLNE